MFIQKPLLYKDIIAAIDYTYNSSHQKEFSICALTNPLFTDTLWAIMYVIYGKQTYSYTPFWAGQIHEDENVSLKPDRNHVENRFLILEPLIGIPEYSKKATVFMEDSVSRVVEQRKFGEITVQKRVFLEEKEIYDSQNLTEKEKLDIQNVIRIDPRYSCFLTY